MSVRDIWAWLIAKRYKYNENRSYNLPDHRINKATALQVSGTQNIKESHEYYKLPQVEYYLRNDPETSGKSHAQLDEHFRRYYHGKVIGVIVISGSYTEDTIPGDEKDCNFFNVPEKSKYNWVISNVISFDVLNSSNPIYLRGQLKVCDFDVIGDEQHAKYGDDRVCFS